MADDDARLEAERKYPRPEYRFQSTTAEWIAAAQHDAYAEGWRDGQASRTSAVANREALAHAIEAAITDNGHRMPRTNETHYIAFIAAGVSAPVVADDRLRALATYAVRHRNMGECPEGPDDTARDPECQVCQWIAAPLRGDS